MPRRRSAHTIHPGEALDHTVWGPETPVWASIVDACGFIPPRRVRSAPTPSSNPTPLIPRRQITAEDCLEEVADLDKLVQRVAARSGCPELIAVARQHSGARARATVERQGSASTQKTARGLDQRAAVEITKEGQVVGPDGKRVGTLRDDGMVVKADGTVLGLSVLLAKARAVNEQKKEEQQEERQSPKKDGTERRRTVRQAFETTYRRPLDYDDDLYAGHWN